MTATTKTTTTTVFFWLSRRHSLLSCTNSISSLNQPYPPLGYGLRLFSLPFTEIGEERDGLAFVFWQLWSRDELRERDALPSFSFFFIFISRNRRLLPFFSQIHSTRLNCLALPWSLSLSSSLCLWNTHKSSYSLSLSLSHQIFYYYFALCETNRKHSTVSCSESTSLLASKVIIFKPIK